MDDDGEILLRSTHLLGYHPSPIRWYVLAVFSLLSLIQGKPYELEMKNKL